MIIAVEIALWLIMHFWPSSSQLKKKLQLKKEKKTRANLANS